MVVLSLDGASGGPRPHPDWRLTIRHWDVAPPQQPTTPVRCLAVQAIEQGRRRRRRWSGWRIFAGITGSRPGRERHLGRCLDVCRSESSRHLFSGLRMLPYQSALRLYFNPEIVKQLNDPFSATVNIGHLQGPVWELDLRHQITGSRDNPSRWSVRG